MQPWEIYRDESREHVGAQDEHASGYHEASSESTSREAPLDPENRASSCAFCCRSDIPETHSRLSSGISMLGTGGRGRVATASPSGGKGIKL